MALATYADLQASVAAWSHRSDLTAVIPDFIVLAEKRINGDLDARLQDAVTTLTTDGTTNVVAVPNGLINLRSLTLQASPNVVLDYLTPDQFNTQYASSVVDRPQSFSIIGSSIYLGPNPDAVYSLQCIYKAEVPALVLGTNWLITSFPNVYLKATLCELARYIRDDVALAAWNADYAAAIRSVNEQDWYSGSTMRVRSDVRM